MSAVVTNTLRSLAPSTSPPAVQRGDGTEVGWFARAWVNFNGTGTVAIRAAGNVSSITDNGTGDYTVNFTTALPDANYAVTGASGSLPATSILRPQHSVAPTSSALRIITVDTSSTATDYEYVNVAIFR